MLDVDVPLYLFSRARLARLSKVVAFHVLPRHGESVKLINREQGDYFAFTVAQVTHREASLPEIWMNLCDLVDGEIVVEFLEDDELDRYLAGYKFEGWTLTSLVPNRTFREDGTSR